MTAIVVQRSLARVAHDRTVVVVAHRLSTIRHADRIYVLHQGALVESGNHGQLMAAEGLYADLFTLQASGYRAEPAAEADADRSR